MLQKNFNKDKNNKKPIKITHKEIQDDEQQIKK